MPFSIAAVLVLACCLALAHAARAAWAWNQHYRALAALPRPRLPKGLGALVLGALVLGDREKLHRQLSAMAHTLGPIFLYRALWLKFVVILEPRLIAQILSREADLDKDHNVTMHELDRLTSRTRRPSLVTHSSHSPQWRLVRKAIAPAFATRNIKQGFQEVVAVVEQLVAALRAVGPDTPVDVDNIGQREALDVIGRVGFGVDFGASRSVGLERDASAEAMLSLQDSIYQLQSRVNNPRRMLLPEWLIDEGVYRRYHQTTERLLKEVRAKGPPAPGDPTIIAHLLRARHPDTGRPLSEEELLPEIGILFLAGLETTGHTIAYTLLLLAQHPAEGARVAAELDAAGLLVTPSRPQPRPLEWDDLARLAVLGRVIKEAMRMLPVTAQGTLRQTRAPLDLRPYGLDAVLPPGTSAYVPFFALFNQDGLWERPHDFWPDRWLDPHADLAPSSHGEAGGEPPERRSGSAAFKTHSDGATRPRRFIPFSDGPRDCVGQSLARVSFTAALALFLSRFTFHIAEDKMGGPEKQRDREQIALTLQFKGGIWMRAVPR